MPTPDQREFLLQEFNALRKEIEIEIKQLRDYLQAAILASGAIWAWLLSRPSLNIPIPVFCLPFALSALLFAQTWAVRHKIYKLGGYLANVERSFQLHPDLGWETQLRKGRIKRDWIPELETVVWFCLCAGNGFAAWYMLKHSVIPSSLI